eukprot:COSAG03_NODE_1505_length_3970_cov_2.229915_3_plen_56_part_00
MESAPAAGGFGGFGQVAAGEPQRTDYDQAARELIKVCARARARVFVSHVHVLIQN